MNNILKTYKMGRDFLNICICGYYGMGNFGDELFLKTFQQIFYEDNIIPWCSCAGTLDINKIDAVIIGGGDLIMPYFVNDSYLPPSLTDHPTWLYGVGVVDYYDEKSWSRVEIEKNKQRISKASKVFARDPHSAELIKRLGFHNDITVVPDIVFAYRETKIPLTKFSNKKTIGACIYSYDDFPFDKIVELFLHLSASGYHIVLIPVINKLDNQFGDMKMCQRLQNALLEAKPQPSVTLMQPEYYLDITYAYLQSIDFLISFKLHPSLAAVRGGVPAFCFSKLGKTSYFLNSIGLGEYFSDFDIPVSEMKSLIDSFLKESSAKLLAANTQIKLIERQSLDSLLSLKKEIYSSKGLN